MDGTDRGLVYSIFSPSPNSTEIPIDAGTEKLFDGDPEEGDRQGRKSQEINLGETYVFRLRRANAAGTLLKSVTVTTQKYVPVNVDQLTPIAKYLADRQPMQGIWAVLIKPGFDEVEFNFQTLLATVPIVEIWRDQVETDLAAVVFPVLSGMQTEHVLRIGEPQLRQSTKFFFKIFAATPRPYTSPPAVLRGSFITARQDARVIYDRIFVVRDGDPGKSSSLLFGFGVGDAAETNRFGTPLPNGEPFIGIPAKFHEEDLSDGDTAHVNKVFEVANAPRRLWVKVKCVDYDDIFSSGSGAYSGQPGGPVGPMTGEWSEDVSEGAWVWTELDTFENGPLKAGFRETPFFMATPWHFGVSFQVFGRLQITAFPRPWIRMRFFGSDFEKLGAAGYGKVVGVSGGAGGKKGSGMLAALGLDGSVYAKAVGAEAHTLPPNQWTRLGGDFAGGLTAVAVDELRVELFALDREGAVFHKSYANGESTDSDWRPLGGSFVGPLAAATTPESMIELFGADREGKVHRLVFQANGHAGPGGWEELGGDVANGPVALDAPGLGVGLFALGRSGEVLHKRRSGRDWQPDGSRWNSLGGQFAGGALSTRLQEDGTLLIVVLTPDKMLHTIEWQDYPEGHPKEHWTEAGSLDDLFQSALPAPEDVPVRPLPPKAGNCDRVEDRASAAPGMLPPRERTL
jgi:hypothetical protein